MLFNLIDAKMLEICIFNFLHLTVNSHERFFKKNVVCINFFWHDFKFSGSVNKF
jgi:hypothetical protein